jgi:ABC-type thiamine transport system ATPase subunit
MKTLFALLLMTTSAYSQTVNNATVNLQGANQSVSITQSGAGHSATLNFAGDSITAIISQSGNTPQSFSLSVTCGFSCPSSPYIVNQY